MSGTPEQDNTACASEILRTKSTFSRIGFLPASWGGGVDLEERVKELVAS